MSRPKRADEANQIYQVLNRGNARSEIFLKVGDYEAFFGTRTCVPGRFKSFPIQDDVHNVVASRYVERNALQANLVERAEDWRWGSLYRWLCPTEPSPILLSPWSVPRLPNWVSRVNEALSPKELASVRWSVKRGSPFGSETRVELVARRLDLTLRPRGRPGVRSLHECHNNDS